MSVIQSAPRDKPILPSGSAVAKAHQLKAADREFLPAALEMLVTPPSPVSLSLMLVICGMFAFALGWSYFGWIDIHAVSPGKIQPSGRSKVVQPLEAGRVVAISVANGSRVNAGDVLLELDPTESSADREAQARDLEAASGEAARRRAAIAVAQTTALQPTAIEFPAGIGETVRDREAGVLIADLDQLRSSVASLRAQLAEKLATKERLASTIAARERVIALAKERVEMREQLDTRGAGSRALVVDALQQYEAQVTTDVGDRGQLIETDAAMRSLERRIEATVTQFVADQMQKLAEVERRHDRLVQELIKAQSKTDRTQLRAPITGTVQQLAVSTIGQVVASGQSLLTVVPLDAPIEVEILIANRDIGFVEAGQSAIIKVDAFPFTRHGAIEGNVAKVSRDAVDERDAANLSDAATAAKPQPDTSGQPARTQNLVFPATVRLARSTIDIEGKEVSLTPGMAVTVEIKTGRRRVIDYLLSPLREVVAQTAHER